MVELDRELQRLRVDIARQPSDEIVLVGVLVIAQRVEDAGLARHGLVAGGPLMSDEVSALAPPDRERDLVHDIQVERRNIGDDERGFLDTVEDG